MDYPFYNYNSEQLQAINLETLDQAALQELAYFIWAVFPDDEPLLAWRKSQLLPLLQLPHFEADDDGDEEAV